MDVVGSNPNKNQHELTIDKNKRSQDTEIAATEVVKPGA